MGGAGQGMGAISAIRSIRPTWHKGQRAADSTRSAGTEASWVAVGSNSERAP